MFPKDNITPRSPWFFLEKKYWKPISGNNSGQREGFLSHIANVAMGTADVEKVLYFLFIAIYFLQGISRITRKGHSCTSRITERIRSRKEIDCCSE